MNPRFFENLLSILGDKSIAIVQSLCAEDNDNNDNNDNDNDNNNNNVDIIAEILGFNSIDEILLSCGDYRISGNFYNSRRSEY